LLRPGDKGENIKEHIRKKRVKVFYGDIEKKKTLEEAVKDVDIIYHLAARTDFEGKIYQEYHRPNVLGTQNLIDLAVKEKVKRFIFFSSIHAVGLTQVPQFADENVIPKPPGFYGKSKLEAERRLNKAYKEHGLPIVIIRPTTVYGPRNFSDTYELIKVISQGKFFLLGKGYNLLGYIYVDNIIEAVRLAQIKKEAIGQTYFISDFYPYTLRELSSTIAQYFGRKLPPFYLPVPLAYLASLSLELGGKLFGFKPPLFRARLKTMTSSYTYDVSKVVKELGFFPTVDLKEGMQRTIAWYKKHNFL